MRILAIDYGRKKVGLAFSEGVLAEPWRVIREKDKEVLLLEIEKEIQKTGAEILVVGISENKMAEETRRFAEKLKNRFNLPLYFQDETLSSQEAGKLAREAGISRKKRKDREDAYAAALVLQSYLESKR